FEPLHAFDPEIERTLHRLRKVRHTNSENSNFTTDESNFSENQEAGSMENNDKTLKELATPDVVYQPWCIQCARLEPAQSYELKSSLIHLLPKFHGLAGEDPYKHLKEFHMTNRLSTTDSTISSTTCPATATIENASSRQFTISRGPNEAIGNQQPRVPTNHELQ
ncbi:hypothetical protein CR513_43970, partial [Mucuna pruriens]